MAGALIRLGNHTSHHGVVLEVSRLSDAGGVGLARVGAKVSCPKCGKNTISSGDTTMIVDGKPVARHGDKTACGATLIAGQQTATNWL